MIALVALALNFVIPGPTGAKGPAGEVGPPGPNGVPLWAVVNQSGNLSHGSGAVNSTMTATGEYTVTFDQSVAACAFSATVGTDGNYGTVLPGPIAVAPVPANPDQVAVSAYNAATGAANNTSFHLVVSCSSGLWATVSPTATLAASRGATGAVHQGAGEYEVDFVQNMTNCSYLATLETVGGVAPVVGVATVAGRYGNPNGVWLDTYALNGTHEDTGFSLLAVCSGPLWGVVNSSGSLVRGSAESVFSLGTGTYELDFYQSVKGCAFLAGTGEPYSVGDYAPSYVSLAGRVNNPNAIYVGTFDATAVSTAESFHFAVFC